jgi:hypothetical protein
MSVQQNVQLEIWRVPQAAGIVKKIEEFESERFTRSTIFFATLRSYAIWHAILRSPSKRLRG